MGENISAEQLVGKVVWDAFELVHSYLALAVVLIHVLLD